MTFLGEYSHDIDRREDGLGFILTLGEREKGGTKSYREREKERKLSECCL